MAAPSRPQKEPASSVMVERFKGRTYPNETVLPLTAGTLTRLPNNPNRMSWTIINEGTGDVRMSNLPNISTTSGFIIGANGGIISQDWTQDGEGVTYEIYLMAVSVNVNVRIREVIRI